jgi:hypothetical protein
MTPEDKNGWDVTISWTGMAVTAVTVLISVFAGLYEFQQGEINKVKLENQLLREKDEIAFQRQLWLERLSTYRKLAEAAGAIVAGANDKEKMQNYISQFTSMYWGSMIFVKDKNVEKPMIDFALAIRDYQGGWRGLDELKLKADSLIEACRKSAITGKFGEQLGNINNPNSQH